MIDTRSCADVARGHASWRNLIAGSSRNSPARANVANGGPGNASRVVIPTAGTCPAPASSRVVIVCRSAPSTAEHDDLTLPPCAATFAEKWRIVVQSCTVDRSAAWSACDPVVRGAPLGLRAAPCRGDGATRSAPAIISGEFGGQFAVVPRSRVPNQMQQRLCCNRLVPVPSPPPSPCSFWSCGLDLGRESGSHNQLSGFVQKRQDLAIPFHPPK